MALGQRGQAVEFAATQLPGGIQATQRKRTVRATVDGYGRARPCW
jgi:hypothetical protein